VGLIEQVLAGDARAAGRAMSLVEDGAPGARALLRGIAPHTGRAHCTGFTGPPGVGKSSLVAALALAARGAGRTVGIVAADPTSAFTGGALLGDRIRMRRLFEDPEVFIRSMATRAHPGSLPPAARDVCRIMDAMGKDAVFLETVGAGQSDVRILRYADTIVLVLSPGTGDFIQAMKAGSMEIADIIVVTKADLPGADQAVADLAAFLETRAGSPHTVAASPGVPSSWTVPVLATSTLKDGEGIQALEDEIDRHARHLRETGELDARRRRRLRDEIADTCAERLTASALADERLAVYVGEVADGRLTAGEAGQQLARDLLENTPSEAGHADDEL